MEINQGFFFWLKCITDKELIRLFLGLKCIYDKEINQFFRVLGFFFVVVVAFLLKGISDKEINQFFICS